MCFRGNDPRENETLSLKIGGNEIRGNVTRENEIQ
jgi:hypothetical protein